MESQAMISIVQASNHDRSISPPVSVETFDHEGRVEDFLRKEHLEDLMAEFQNPKYSSAGLDMDSFCAVMQKYVSKDVISRKQLALLFMKIDTSCDGNVDWDELCTYMLVAYEEKEEDAATLETQRVKLRDAVPVRRCKAISKQPIACIAPLARRKHGYLQTNRFVTITEDGIISMHKADLTPIKSTQLQLPRRKVRAVAATVLGAFGKVAVSFSDRTLKFYDLPCSVSEEVCQVTGFQDTIMCLAFSEGDPTDTLLMGDMGGRIHALSFHEHRFHLTTASDRREFRSDVPLSKLGPDHYWSEPMHWDLVEAISPYAGPGGFISCSATTQDAMVVCDSDVRKFVIPKGVRAFAFSKQSNVLVSGGVDGHLRLWNPHVNHRSNAILEGHKASILEVAVQEGGSGQADADETASKPAYQFIISLSADAVVKLWSLHTHACLLSLPSSHLNVGDHPISACLYERASGSLLCANEQLHAAFLGGELMTSHHDTHTHSQPLTEVKYNPVFGQVVTACRESMVNVWNLTTGERLLKFGPAHHNAEVTRVAFDRSQRRLLTAASDGTIKLWNFNVGLALMKLQTDLHVEILSMLEMHDGRIVSGGWDRTINMFSRCDGSSYYVDPDATAIGKGHTADVTGIVELKPMYLASCSINAQIITWKVLDRIIPIRQHSLRDHAPDCSVLGMTAWRFTVQTPSSRGGASHVLLWGSGSGAGQMWLMSTMSGKLCSQVHVSRHAVNDLAVCEQGDRVVTADAVGTIKVWSCLCWHKNVDSGKAIPEPTLLAKWMAHVQPITRISLAEVRPPQQGDDSGKGSTGHADEDAVPHAFVMTASEDCTCRLWSIEGEFVGTFGQTRKWNVFDSSTFSRRKPADVAELLQRQQQKQLQDNFRRRSRASFELDRDLAQQTSSFLFQTLKQNGRIPPKIAEHQEGGVDESTQASSSTCLNSDASRHQRPLFQRHERRQSTTERLSQRVTIHQRRLGTMERLQRQAEVGFRGLECSQLDTVKPKQLTKPKRYSFHD